MIDYGRKLRELRATPHKCRLDPTPEMIRGFEERFGLSLPNDYRTFIACHGANHVSAAVLDTYLTSFFGFLDDVKGCDLTWAMTVCEGYGICVPVADNMTGAWFYLMCSGQNRGRVMWRLALGGAWNLVASSFDELIRLCRPLEITK